MKGRSDIVLPDDPEGALRAIRAASADAPVLVIKWSGRCGVSSRVETRVEEWLDAEGERRGVKTVPIDVIGERSLARGLTDLVGIRHESPQAILFRAGEVVWHASHYDIDGEALTGALEKE